MFRMLVLDLDGTTLRHDGQLAQVDIDAAHALQAAGVRVSIATGRLFTGTRHIADALGIDGPVAVMNGSELIDAGTGVARHGHYLEPETLGSVHQVLSDHGVSTFLYHSRRIHYARRDERLAPYLRTWSLELHAHDDVHAAPDWQATDVVAVCAAGEADDVHAARDALALPPDIGTELFDTWDGERFMKIRSATEDKGTALARLAADAGFTTDQCVVVGDWINDLPLFAAAGRSYAMRDCPVMDDADEVLEALRGQGGAIAEVARRVWGL